MKHAPKCLHFICLYYPPECKSTQPISLFVLKMYESKSAVWLYKMELSLIGCPPLINSVVDFLGALLTRNNDQR